MTSRNPIPGCNVMDHMSFAIEYGVEEAHRILCGAIRQILDVLGCRDLSVISVCGNPIQLSLFEGIDIRDLAYAGENKLKAENITPPERNGHSISGEFLGYPDTKVLIPPSVRHEIGADALAMMTESGFLDDDMCMVTDYGTNAEMALKVNGRIYTGSAAAGPAMEGQQIKCGMLAGPGAVSDLVRTASGWRTKVLDENLHPQDGPMINLRSDLADRTGLKPIGITGTGVVALIYAGFEDGRIDEATVRNEPIHIARKIEFGTEDLKEAGKALGAIRAGHLTLMIKAGVDPSKIRKMYMAGASGTYVDPLKARKVGLVPPDCTQIVQVGNTSLELAKKIAFDPSLIEKLNGLKGRLVTDHIMFASCDIFRDLYTYEYGFWNDGMPLNRYRRALERYGVEGYLDRDSPAEVIKLHETDISDTGGRLDIIGSSPVISTIWDCSECMACVRGCPEKALSFENGVFSIWTGYCLGTACLRCVENCPEKVFDYSRFSQGSAQ